ncbi:ABC transporter ATP-binding protein [Primorskyibacter aestuariivivens]|uniref:ABC transporter ATP-binding protein n=1 Tax=Primorskyibacter aestuariivivens TaxID=1888912 RepID=UPI0023011EB8|nr:ABC transporter ATP-binding protein [Primorskyibacter aestuariivivens]MDA7430073.1 ABC transporter ATP-binding protein [Primorskyibacter aestuariivivens]
MSKHPPQARGLALWLWRGYLRKHIGLLLIAMLFMSFEGAMFGAVSYMMKPMFDFVFIGGRSDLLIWVGLAFLAIFAIRAGASVVQKVLLTRLSQITAAEMRQDLVTHLMTLEGQFHQSHSPGYLMQRVEGDVGAIGKVWRTIITGAGRDVVALISLFAVALNIDWRWTLVALLGAPLLIAPAVIVQHFVRKNARVARDVAAGLSVRLNEIFHGIVPIKLNRLEKYQARRYGELTDKRVHVETRSALGQASIPGLVDLMAGVGFMGVLLYGGGEIISGEKTVGDFMAFFTALGLTFEPLRRLGAVSGVWQVAAAAMERLRELLELQPALASPANPVAAPDDVPEIVLEDVHLAYEDAPVLKGTSFVAEAGKTTALVGASGAGKSTVFNLVTRLVDPQQGRATIGGVDVRDMALDDLRGLFSVVSQEALLFDESLRDNIVLDRVDVSEDALKRALDAAHVSDFLPRLSDGLDSPAGPRGSNLSGGQRQRVAIARAVLRDTPILLLDEATSALDTASEALVQEALDRLAEGRTTLVIAHRLSTVRHADKIVVMDQGQVVEEGTHAELMARGGAYARLQQMQAGDDQRDRV